MHLVHTYIAYRVSNICSYYMCRIGTVTCVCVTHTNPLTRYLIEVEGVCTLYSYNDLQPDFVLKIQRKTKTEDLTQNSASVTRRAIGPSL
jgi:hypothetical protein